MSLAHEYRPKRLLNRADAAFYVSESPAHFDKGVKAGKWPQPIQLSERRLAWDIHDLDQAIESLKNAPADEGLGSLV